ncbi:hypothetical protein [Rhizobium alvei]|uniref:Uncharacterized protein n=1 Tax=Rhizobium alvei TaxID=1132659 RepID=A0ABT8YFH7_9HYPH|nr:hypothetical protein [Rhizobium alvei]MDO6962444.1 hypothetical protein [Rhizobium alvei]
MLSEALNFAATYAAGPRRISSEINGSVMLRARAERCALSWKAHEEQCHATIGEAIAGLSSKRTVAILGSGLLRDTPIGLLSQQFERVLLFDLQHLASTRLWTRLRGLGNLSYVWRDLSGFEEYRATGQPPRPLAFLEAIADLDFVISANLLSQIGVGVGYRLKAGIAAPTDTLPTLIRAHVDGLSALNCPACLITDIAYEVRDRTGRVLERDDLMQGVTLPDADRSWDWTVAPFGELSPDYQAVHQVKAIRLPQAGRAPTLP